MKALEPGVVAGDGFRGGLRLVHVVTSDVSARGCPRCGVPASRVKECVVTRPRGVTCGGAPIGLVWHITCGSKEVRRL